MVLFCFLLLSSREKLRQTCWNLLYWKRFGYGMDIKCCCFNSVGVSLRTTVARRCLCAALVMDRGAFLRSAHIALLAFRFASVECRSAKMCTTTWMAIQTNKNTNDDFILEDALSTCGSQSSTFIYEINIFLPFHVLSVIIICFNQCFHFVPQNTAMKSPQNVVCALETDTKRLHQMSCSDYIAFSIVVWCDDRRWLFLFVV